MGKIYFKPFVGFCLCILFSVSLNAQNEKDLQELVKQKASQLHISDEDAATAKISSYFTDAASGIQYVYIQQTFQSVKVFNNIISVSLKGGNILYSSGSFIPDMAVKTASANRVVQADAAIAKAALELKLPPPSALQIVVDRFAEEKKYVFASAGIAKRNIETELVWISEDNGQTVHLAWNVNIDVLGSADWWNVRIDAGSGLFLSKDNWTVHEEKKLETDEGVFIPKVLNQGTGPRKIRYPQKQFFGTPPITGAGYNVIPFPNESPAIAGVAIDHEPWLRAGAGNNAITYGWHYDGVDSHDSTRGNNVHAYLDAANKNNFNPPNFSALSTTPSPTLNFNFTPNFSIQPTDNNTRLFAITNLFYWNNLMHDVMYQYGFNEISGNFQADNISRGGTGNDFVKAEAQDGSGTDNANFSTPVDGSSGRMQMYLFAGVPAFNVSAPAPVAGNYFSSESGFSTANKLKNVGPVTGQLIYYNDDPGGTTHFACGAPGTPANSISGKIALIIRGGGCAGGFIEKVKNAQNAGAIAVVVVNNVAGFPITMGGTDNTITIPAVMISQSDGATLAAQLGAGITLSLTAGPNLDGDMDNGVICHEYGHGISNRLTGGRLNASCLGNAEQGGEGWSDYLALMMTTNWNTATLSDGTISRAMGTYVEGQPLSGTGIRTFPYSTDMGVDPHTYADLATVSTEVHYIGEVWCSALWDMTWNIIQQEGAITSNIYNSSSSGGNIISLQLVLEGMRLQPCRPGFLDARNAIIAADSIMYGGRHKCAIWNAFARRGMGFSASEGSPGSAVDQVAAFDLPSAVFLTKSAPPASLNNGNQVTLNLRANCQCQVPLTNYTIRDTIPAGFTYVSSTGGSLAGNVVSFSSVDFTSALQSRSFTVTLQGSQPGCNIDSSIRDDRDISTVGGLANTTSTGATQWVASTTRANSGTTAWFAADPGSTTDYSLISSAFTAGNLSALSFWHYYVTENFIDGGRVELSTDGGSTWQDAGPYMVQNGYNTIMNSTSPWGLNQRSFSGVSFGQGNGRFINTIVNLSSFAGQSLKVRFRMRSNGSNTGSVSYEGWFVDDIMLLNGCGGMVRTGLFNSSAARIDTAAAPLFVRPLVALPVNLLSFTARQAGQDVLLNWQSSNEVNFKEYRIEHSTDGNTWTTIGTTDAKSQDLNDYLYYHYRASTGANHYRIKMVDIDGRYRYSVVRVVTISIKERLLVELIPNPASQFTSMHFSEVMSNPVIAIVDAMGKVVSKIQLNGAISSYDLSTARLPSGSYMVRISTDKLSVSQKLIVRH